MYGGEPTGRPLPATSTATVTSDLVCIILLRYLPSYCNPNGNSSSGYGSSTFKAQRASGKPLVAVFYVMRVDCKIFSSQPKTRRNCTAWHKHGIVLLQRSELKFPRDLTICMDLEANPGDTLLFNKSRAWITQSCPVQPSNYANSSSKSPTVYSIKQLLTLRKFASKIPQTLKNQ